MQQQHRSQGALLAAAGLGALVLVLIATPDGQAWVLGAWLVVLAGVAAVALGIALGFRRQAREEADAGQPQYLTADWVGGAQQFTVGDRAEPPVPEPTPAPAPIKQPVENPETPPAVLPHPPSEPEMEPSSARHAMRYPRVAAALMMANAVRELVRPGRAGQ
jgi:hypothetical protein